MITGFNTDIEFEGKTYHVQTEDKGLERPIVMSLIYDRGTILASKRTSYEDIIVGDSVDEDVLAERLQKQHRLICAAVRTGRINDLIKMSQKTPAEAAPMAAPPEHVQETVEELPQAVESPVAESTEEVVELPAVAAVEPLEVPASAGEFLPEPIEEVVPALSIPVLPTIAPPAMPSSFSMPDLDLSEVGTVSADTGISDILALPFVPPVGEEFGTESREPAVVFEELGIAAIPMPGQVSEHAAVTKPLDLDLSPAVSAPVSNPSPQIELDPEPSYEVIEDEILFADEIEAMAEILLPEEAVEIVSEMTGQERPSNTRLTIELLGDSRFKGGEHKSVSFMVCRGSERKVVNSADVMVKILGSSFRPMIFHAKTDSNGLAKVNLQFPSFTEGRAALLVRVISEGEEVELRRVVAHG